MKSQFRYYYFFFYVKVNSIKKEKKYLREVKTSEEAEAIPQPDILIDINLCDNNPGIEKT